MNLKKFTKLTFILGLTILLISLILPIVLSYIKADGNSVGIIGGAEGFHSKLVFFKMVFYHIYNIWARLSILLGLTLVVIASLCKFCKNIILKYMSIKTTFCALLFSFFSTLTVLSIGSVLYCIRFKNPWADAWHIMPLYYVSSIIGSVIGIVLLIITIIKYIRLSKTTFSYKRLLLDIGFSIICLPFFYWLITCTYFLTIP